MFSALDISTSGLVAQQTRLNAVSSNIANFSTQVNEDGELQPYQARFPIFETVESSRDPGAAAGVRVAEIRTSEIEPNYKYQPYHPNAIQSGRWEGYVPYPNINLTAELVDSMEATRAYEANVGVIEMTKNIEQLTLRILI